MNYSKELTSIILVEKKKIKKLNLNLLPFFKSNPLKLMKNTSLKLR